MGVASDSLRLLWPRGRAWRKVPDSPLALALGDVLDDARDVVRQIVSESRPGTATDTLPEWNAALGLAYDLSRPIEEMRERLESIRLSVGGMTLSLLRNQMAREFPGVVINEISATSELGLMECGVSYCGAVDGDYSPTMYEVTGTVADDYDATRVVAILAHYAPAHLIADVRLTVLSLSSTAELGVGRCGLAELGYDGT